MAITTTASPTDSALAALFQPLQLGAISIPNRIIMAPLTRARSGLSRIPNDLMLEHYRQRTSAGLIITEATQISEQAAGSKPPAFTMLIRLPVGKKLPKQSTSAVAKSFYSCGTPDAPLTLIFNPMESYQSQPLPLPPKEKFIPPWAKSLMLHPAPSP